MKVKTNVTRSFINMIDKYFPKTNKLHKIINRKTGKDSNSCLPNVKQMIKLITRTPTHTHTHKKRHQIKSNSAIASKKQAAH